MIEVRERWRRLRQNDVRISAAETERVNTGQAFAAGFRERLGRRGQPKFQFLKIVVGFGFFKMQATGNLRVLKNEHRFKTPRHAGSGLEMTNICLYRTDRQWSETIFAECRCES